MRARLGTLCTAMQRPQGTGTEGKVSITESMCRYGHSSSIEYVVSFVADGSIRVHEKEQCGIAPYSNSVRQLIGLVDELGNRLV